MLLSSGTFKQYVDWAYHAYQEKNVSNQTYRLKGSIPYITHPLGSALLLLADTKIPEQERLLGFKILVLHDVLEDTALALPEWVEEKVKFGVEELTYQGPESLEEKIKWSHSKQDPFIKLLILHDAFWTLYEYGVDGPIKRKELWQQGVGELAEIIAKDYGNIRIVQIARTVVEHTQWDSEE